MKIFVLLSRIPWPLEKGDKLRAFNQIKSLAANNEVHLCALNDDKSVNKEDATRQLKPYCKSITYIDITKLQIVYNLGIAFLKGLPIQCGYFYNKSAHKQIHALIQSIQPDMLFGQFVRVAPYLEQEEIKKTLDYQDVLSYGMKRRMDKVSWFKRPIFNMEYRRLQRYEHHVFDKFDIKTIICDSDRQLIDHEKRQEILIVPNGVDFEHFSPYETTKKYDIIFSGNMAYPPNVDAVDFLAKEIMPLVWKQIPTAKLCIAGATPAPSVKNAANENITVTGWVDDMRDMYAQSKIFIAPMRMGTGLQNKLLEAMSMNLPCITTNLANGSLQATPNTEILVGNTANELANHIISLLSNNDTATTIANNGNKFVHSNYEWNSTTNIMESAMMQSVENK